MVEKKLNEEVLEDVVAGSSAEVNENCIILFEQEKETDLSKKLYNESDLSKKLY